MRTMAEALVVVLTVSAFAARADDNSLQSSGCAPVRQITFRKGTTEAVVKDVLGRTETRCYDFFARTGQELAVRLASESGNVLFAIYQPGWNLKKGDDDVQQLEVPLKGAALDDEANHFSGHLPASGNYLLVVGLLRGGAGDYSTTISIR